MKNRPLCGICLALFLLILTMTCVGREKFIKELRPSPLEKSAKEGEELVFTGRIYQKEIKDNHQVLYLKDNSLKEPRIIVYDESKRKLHIGNELQVSGELFFFSASSNPGCFNQKLYYQKQNIHAGIWGKKIVVTDTKTAGIRDRLFEIRNAWKEKLILFMGERNGEVLAAILLGEKEGVEPELKELYQTSGIGHILAISGLHLSFIGVGLYRLFTRISGSCQVGGTAGILFLLLYICMVGMTVSAVRAMVMFLFRVGADMCGRHYDGMTALAVALVTVLLWRPLCIYDGGFWLSFGAVGAILFLLPLFQELPVQGLWAGISIHLVLLPVTLFCFYEFPPYAILMNILIIPLMSVLMLLGIVGSMFLAVPLVSGFLLRLAAGILHFYEHICHLFMKLPGARVVTGRPEIWQLIIYALCFAMALYFKIYGKSRGRWMLFLVVGLTVLCGRWETEGKVQVTVLDVGQGDGIFIKGPSGGTYLIDGGSSDTKKVGQYRVEPFLLYQGTDTLDYVFVSHGDTDHMNGIEELLLRQDVGVKIHTLVFPVKEVWDETLEALAQTAVSQGTKVAVISSGQKIREEEMEIQCLQPESSYEGEPGNGSSMVLSLQYGAFDMLFTGDVEGSGEESLTELLRTKPERRTIDVLKVSHHGSANATTEEFLAAANPGYGLISAGENNRYGHPHEETLKRLEDAGVIVHSTKEEGAITVTTDGKKITVREYGGK